jgi:hypothetical protein
MKSLWMSLAFLYLAAGVSAERTLSLDEIIENHTKALGGKSAIESAKSMEFELHIAEPKFEVDGVYKVDRQHRMRIDIFSDGKRVFTEAFDGKKGWEQGEDKPAEYSSEQGSKALWHGTVLPGKLVGLHEYKKLGHKIELIGREEIEGVNYYVLQITLSDGFQTRIYLHPETWLIERGRDFAAVHVDIDPTKQPLESRYLDYRSVEGVMRSFQTTQKNVETGAVTQSVTIKSIKVNPSFDSSTFTKP